MHLLGGYLQQLHRGGGVIKEWQEKKKRPKSVLYSFTPKEESRKGPEREILRKCKGGGSRDLKKNLGEKLFVLGT